MPSLQERVAEFTYQEKLTEILETLTVHGVCSKNRRNKCEECKQRIANAVVAINALNQETLGEDEVFNSAFHEEYHGHRRNGRNELRADLRKRFGLAELNKEFGKVSE